jgi:hypothetical protein
MHFTLEDDMFIEFLENHGSDMYAAQDAILFREYDAEGLFIGTYDGIGCDIAATDILF